MDMCLMSQAKIFPAYSRNVIDYWVDFPLMWTKNEIYWLV